MILKEFASKYVTLTDKLEDLTTLRDIDGNDSDDIEDAIYDLEDELDKLEVDFYTNAQKFYFSTLTKEDNSLVLTYYFFGESNDEIRIQFIFSKKEEINNLYLIARIDDGFLSLLEKIEHVQLLDSDDSISKVSSTSCRTILLSITPSIDISLSNFFNTYANDFLDNYNTYVEKLGLETFLEQDTFNTISLKLNPYLNALTLSLNDAENKENFNKLKLFETYDYNIEDLMDFSKNKAKEYLYTDLNNKLAAEKTEVKRLKI